MLLLSTCWIRLYVRSGLMHVILDVVSAGECPDSTPVP